MIYIFSKFNIKYRISKHLHSIEILRDHLNFYLKWNIILCMWSVLLIPKLSIANEMNNGQKQPNVYWVKKWKNNKGMMERWGICPLTSRSRSFSIKIYKFLRHYNFPDCSNCSARYLLSLVNTAVTLGSYNFFNFVCEILVIWTYINISYWLKSRHHKTTSPPIAIHVYWINLVHLFKTDITFLIEGTFQVLSDMEYLHILTEFNNISLSFHYFSVTHSSQNDL